MARQSSGSISATGANTPIPALLTRMSQPPRSRATDANRRSTDSYARTSQAYPRAPEPIARAASSAAGRARAVSATVAPSRASASAMPRPMPRFPPVTTAIFPLSSVTGEGKRAEGRLWSDRSSVFVFLPQALDAAHHAGMPAPLIERHRSGGEQIRDHHGPGLELAEQRGAERDVECEEPDLQREEQHQQDEEHDREALEQRHAVRDRNAEQDEDHEVERGISGDRERRDHHRLGGGAPAVQQHGAQQRGSEERPARERVDDQEPHRDRQRSDHAGEEAIEHHVAR